MPRPMILVLLGLALLVPVGCQKVDYQHTISMEAGDIKSTTITAPQREQHVRVAVDSSASPVDVYIVLEKDRQQAIEALNKDKPLAQALASKKRVRNDTLEATIPAKNEYAVVLTGAGGPTAVQLHITAR